MQASNGAANSGAPVRGGEGDAEEPTSSLGGEADEEEDDLDDDMNPSPAGLPLWAASEATKQSRPHMGK